MGPGCGAAADLQLRRQHATKRPVSASWAAARSLNIRSAAWRAGAHYFDTNVTEVVCGCWRARRSGNRPGPRQSLGKYYIAPARTQNGRLVTGPAASEVMRRPPYPVCPGKPRSPVERRWRGVSVGEGGRAFHGRVRLVSLFRSGREKIVHRVAFVAPVFQGTVGEGGARGRVKQEGGGP